VSRARRWGVSRTEAVQRLSTAELRVAFCGFAPGFAYLTGLPAEWAVPRLPTPRPRVPAGSVALAGPYAGIYPTASPGGWRLVGRTEATLFDVHRDPPARLVPGTRVRLVEKA
jgi:KipI family sensor histidine kinase inhibitor